MPSSRAALALFHAVLSRAWRIACASTPSFALWEGTSGGNLSLLKSLEMQREVIDRDGVLTTEEEGVLQGVFQLSHVAGPGVVHENLFDIGR